MWGGSIAVFGFVPVLWVGLSFLALAGAGVEGSRHIQQSIEVFKCSELRQYGLVPSLGRPDCPGTPHVIGFGPQTVVRALAIDTPNRMDGREVQNIETHFRDSRELSFHIAKRAVTSPIRSD